PRNYHHIVLDEVRLLVENDYNKLVLAAVAEVPDHHGFITEYAGSSDVAKGALGGYSLDGNVLAGLTDVRAFVRRGVDAVGRPPPSRLRSIFAAHIPEPAELAAEGLSSDDFYSKIEANLDRWSSDYPNHAPLMFDARATADEIMARIVDPPRKANA